jgi:hypothetical protein
MAPQVVGVHVHTPFEQISGGLQLPQPSDPPQPSAIVPQFLP